MSTNEDNTEEKCLRQIVNGSSIRFYLSKFDLI